MALKRRTAPPRFRVGDRVRIKPTLRLRHSGKHAVVAAVTESKYAQTLDKYMVRVDGHIVDEEVYDIELDASPET